MRLHPAAKRRVDVEQKIAEELFLRYGDLLNGSSVNDRYIGLEVIAESSRGSSWYSRPNGKLRVIVGNYGNKKQFKQLKDGSFSYDKITTELHDRYVRSIHTEKVHQVREANYKSGKVVEKELKVRNGMSEWSSALQYNTYNAKNEPLFTLKLNTLTAEQAEALLAAATKAGIDLSKV